MSCWPIVPRKFYAICVDLHRTQTWTSRMSLGLAPSPPEDTSEANRPPNSFVHALCVSLLSSRIAMIAGDCYIMLWTSNPETLKSTFRQDILPTSQQCLMGCPPSGWQCLRSEVKLLGGQSQEVHAHLATNEICQFLRVFC